MTPPPYPGFQGANRWQALRRLVSAHGQGRLASGPGHSQDWGLNHVRFHSWCPPEAAFAAADELGVYFQVEFPNKRSAFKAPESTDAPKRNIDYLDVPGADPTASLYDYAVREAPWSITASRSPMSPHP